MYYNQDLILRDFHVEKLKISGYLHITDLEEFWQIQTLCIVMGDIKILYFLS